MVDAFYGRCHQSVVRRIYPLLFRLMYCFLLPSMHIASVNSDSECALGFFNAQVSSESSFHNAHSFKLLSVA